MYPTSPGLERHAPNAAHVHPNDWRAVHGVDPQRTAFPAAARCGDDRVWIHRLAAGFIAVAYSCPHAHQTMDTAQFVEGGRAIRCSYHHYAFDVSDGRGINCAGYTLAIYDVKDEAGRLLIRRRAARK